MNAIPFKIRTININENDVICGRRGATNNNKGNTSFRQLVALQKPKYLASSKVEKKYVAKFIIDTIRRRGGRFLKYDNSGGELVDIGDLAAMEKTCQALREGLKVRTHKKKASAETHSRPGNLQPALGDHNISQPSYVMSASQLNYSFYPDYANQPKLDYMPKEIYSMNEQSISCIDQGIGFSNDFIPEEPLQPLGRCTCKKSNCLKLYCQCFASSFYCVPNECRCSGCYNSVHYTEVVLRSKEKIAERKRSEVKHIGDFF